MAGRKLKLGSKLDNKKVCVKCEKTRDRSVGFYSTESDLYPDKKYPVCKICIAAKLPPFDENSKEYLEALKSVLGELNRPFSLSLWQSSIEEAKKLEKDVFGMYMKNVALVMKGATSKDSDQTHLSEDAIHSKHTNNKSLVSRNEIVLTPEDKKNEEDVLRMLGYDPFESENSNDKRYLYNKLIDFLDEGTLEDSFKLPAVIEIVKSFNQIDKINNALSAITSDVEKIASNVGGIKSLIDAKEKMLKSVLALAKDNGISVNHNNNKSKGGNTLNGIVKKLSEIGLDAAEVNLFDLETSNAMKQIADISNRSIMDQLLLDENDYTDMIAEQKQMIKKLDEKVIVLEEENRKLKIKLKQVGSVGS